VHVWRARLDVKGAALARLNRVISPVERARADRLLRAADRRRFVAAHGVLRRILGQYTQVVPRALVFRYGPFGKPELHQETDQPPLAFNLSHSGDCAIYAVAPAGNLGVDIEQVRPLANFERIARRRFPAADVQALFALPAARREAAFFIFWVRNEALVKATGEGLRGLGTIRTDQVTVLDLKPFPGCVAALAVHDFHVHVRCFEAA
jgi:4'-phosphopantetheinyl transferase